MDLGVLYSSYLGVLIILDKQDNNGLGYFSSGPLHFQTLAEIFSDM